MKTTETMRNSESKSQEAMATLHITSYPYVTMYGDLDVPEELLAKGDLAIREYVSDHWDEICFDETDTDFTGTEFEFE